MARFGLDAAEVSRLQDIVELASAGAAGPAAVHALLDGLQDLVGCDCVAYFVQDATARRRAHYQHVAHGERVLAAPGVLAEEAATSADDPFWQHYWSSLCSRPDWAGVPVSQAISEFLTPRQWRADPMHEVLADQDGPVVDEILTAFPETG